MAITKIKAIRSTVENAISYITSHAKYCPNCQKFVIQNQTAKRMKKMRKGRDALRIRGKKAFIEACLQVQKLREQEFILLPLKMAF